MQALARSIAEALRSDRCDAEPLGVAGDEEPARAAEAFLALARDVEMGAALDTWVPALLGSARPGFGARALLDLAERRRAADLAPLDLPRAPALPRILGSSNFLARLLLSNPDWTELLEGEPPPPPEPFPVDADWEAVRRAKYRALLRIAARDLLDRPFRDSLAELSDLADHSLAAGLASAEKETGVPAPALFGLGKLGGRELNFSSDVDLLFLYDPPEGADDLEHNHAVARLVQRLKAGLELRSVEGFAYRVDLDLRPEGRTGALANSVDAAFAYYETFGAEWERQMLIRLRPIAGPDDTARRFAEGIAPFVYRRLIDPGVMRSVREMKARIEDERRRAGRDLEADLKEGPGGIRDIEFLVQSFQLFFGGRHHELRTGNVLDALEALAGLGLLPEPVATSLVGAYTWLRRAEHAVQLPEEKQTARFPREPSAQRELARRMSYPDAEGESARASLLDDWTTVRSEVRSHFEALVLEEER